MLQKPFVKGWKDERYFLNATYYSIVEIVYFKIRKHACEMGCDIRGVSGQENNAETAPQINEYLKD